MALDVVERLEEVDLAGELVGVAVSPVRMQDEGVGRGELAGRLLPAVDEAELAQVLAAAVAPDVQPEWMRRIGPVRLRHDQAVRLDGAVDLRDVAAHHQPGRRVPGARPSRNWPARSRPAPEQVLRHARPRPACRTRRIRGRRGPPCDRPARRAGAGADRACAGAILAARRSAGPARRRRLARADRSASGIAIPFGGMRAHVVRQVVRGPSARAGPEGDEQEAEVRRRIMGRIVLRLRGYRTPIDETSAPNLAGPRRRSHEPVALRFPQVFRDDGRQPRLTPSAIGRIIPRGRDRSGGTGRPIGRTRRAILTHGGRRMGSGTGMDGSRPGGGRCTGRPGVAACRSSTRSDSWRSRAWAGAMPSSPG